MQEQDDLVQATFTACLSAAPRFCGEGTVRSFLFSIACDVLRRLDPRPGSGPSTAFGRKAEVAVSIAAMRRLAVELQTALELHDWEEMTVAEIARVLELPVGTVETRLRRARTLLAELMAEHTGSGANPEAVMAALTPTRKQGSGSGSQDLH